MTIDNSYTMSRYNHKKQLHMRAVVFRALVAVFGLMLVVAFLPREVDRTYSVNQDRPWYGRDLVAPFEFPLLKSEEHLQAEQDSVRSLFAPYFNLKERVKVDMLTQWHKDAEKKRTEEMIPTYLIKHVTAKLQYIYEHGVVDATDYEQLLVGQGVNQLGIVNGKFYEIANVCDVFTPKTAYQYLLSNPDSARFSRQQMQHLNLSPYIQANLVYDAKKSETALREALAEILPTSGLVLKGTRIVDRGEIVTADIALRIRSLNAEIERRDSTVNENYYTMLAGQTLYCAIIIVSFVLFLMLFRNDYIDDTKHVALLAMLVLTMPVITALMLRFPLFNIYIIPYAVIPVMARIFMDSRMAAKTMAASVLLSAVGLSQPFSFIVVQFVAGMVAIYSLRDLSERSQLFRCAIYVTLSALFTRFSIDLVNEGNIQNIGWLYYVSILVAGILMLFTYPLLFMFERMFGFTSNVTLVELNNVNTPLLRSLSQEAPGTFQHCLQVANLASDVANAIGGKSQLVRTGALYHDIGKIEHPGFFTENQIGINPHDRLTPVQSARVIVNHVSSGLELAARHNLPQVIRDFIATHHGAGRAMYFYIKEKERLQGIDPDPAPFTYPGPNPSTMEQAILMMADAVEAASRSLREYTDQSIAALVDKIVDGQVAAGYFNNCPITYRDIMTAKRVMASRLRTIYHTRISYPDLK